MRARWLVLAGGLALLAVALVACPRDDGADTRPEASPEVEGESAAQESAGDEPPATSPGTRERRRVRADVPRTERDDTSPDTAGATPAQEPVYADGEIPEADRGTGEHAVTLALIDDVTGDAASSRVRLWRLDVPADARWPEGDHVQTHSWTGSPGVQVSDLPAGRYRVEVLGALPGTDDPPAFDVPAPEDRVELRVTMPQPVATTLRVVDENGTPLTSGERAGGGSGASFGVPGDAPAWASPRSHRSVDSGLGGLGGGRRNVRRSRFRPVTADSDGAYPLPAVRAKGRHVSWNARVDLRFEGRPEVHARPASDTVHHGSYLAVAPRRELVLAHVRFPDGLEFADALSVEMVCTAVPVVRAAPDGHWRTIPVKVAIELPGYEPLTYEWRIVDAPYPLVDFVAKESE